MFSLYHDEQPSSVWQPRHPLVCIIDFTGILMIFTLIYRHGDVKHWEVGMYLASLVVMYVVSIVHHWFKHTELVNKLDHSMILVVIAFTGLPYWGVLFPSEMFWVVWMVIPIGLYFRWFHKLSTVASAALYVGAGIPMVIDWENYWNHIQSPVNPELFFLGVALYVWQLLIYSHGRAKNKPTKRFGFREHQHVWLWLAVFSHVHTALTVIN